CEILGFPKAELNECGYCVGEDTGLDNDYGKNCAGNCGSSTRIDCYAICDDETIKNECGRQGITQCQLVLDSYVEYKLVHASIERCEIPGEYGPLEYQLYAQSSDEKYPFPVTVSQISNVFIFYGVPATNEEGTLEYSVKICDSFHYCEMTSKRSVDIESNRNNTAKDFLDLAARYHNVAGDAFSALSLIATVMRSPQNSQFLQNRALQSMLDYTVKMLQKPSQTLTNGQISLTFHVLSKYVQFSDNQLLSQRIFDAIYRLAEKSMGLHNPPDAMTIKHTIHNILTFRKNDEQKFVHPNVLRAALRAYKTLLKVTAANMALETQVTFGSEDNSEDETVTVVTRNTSLEDISISVKLKDGNSIVAKVTVGDELKKIFKSPWKCAPNTDCESVVYSLTLFSKSVLFPQNKHTFRLTPIAEYSIYSPNTGNEQRVKGLLKSVLISITLVGNQTAGGQTYATECLYWNEVMQMWDSKGVHFTGFTAGEANCWAGHLTAFAVFRTDQSLQIGVMIGAVVAALVAMLLLVVPIVCIIQRRKDKLAIGASSQRLVPRHLE
ncbi:hypothetical protein B4U80_09878, partial [Leptotrombidium deliense]